MISTRDATNGAAGIGFWSFAPGRSTAAFTAGMRPSELKTKKNTGFIDVGSFNASWMSWMSAGLLNSPGNVAMAPAKPT